LRPPYRAAGILPIWIHDCEGEKRIFLGLHQQIQRRHKPSTPSLASLSDFGGKLNESDLTPAHTALREFYEELGFPVYPALIHAQATELNTLAGELHYWFYCRSVRIFVDELELFVSPSKYVGFLVPVDPESLPKIIWVEFHEAIKRFAMHVRLDLMKSYICRILTRLESSISLPAPPFPWNFFQGPLALPPFRQSWPQAHPILRAFWSSIGIHEWPGSLRHLTAAPLNIFLARPAPCTRVDLSTRMKWDLVFEANERNIMGGADGPVMLVPLLQSSDFTHPVVRACTQGCILRGRAEHDVLCPGIPWADEELAEVCLCLCHGSTKHAHPTQWTQYCAVTKSTPTGEPSSPPTLHNVKAFLFWWPGNGTLRGPGARWMVALSGWRILEAVGPVVDLEAEDAALPRALFRDWQHGLVEWQQGTQVQEEPASTRGSGSPTEVVSDSVSGVRPTYEQALRRLDRNCCYAFVADWNLASTQPARLRLLWAHPPLAGLPPSPEVDRPKFLLLRPEKGEWWAAANHLPSSGS